MPSDGNGEWEEATTNSEVWVGRKICFPNLKTMGSQGRKRLARTANEPSTQAIPEARCPCFS